jgi:precorrin-3B synthase
MASTLAQHLSTPTPNPSPQGGGERRLSRGWCPGLSAPMPTGDGLLVRLRPVGIMTLAAFAGLCAAARAFGNGIVEVTARGSIQVRGLRPASASKFADAVAALDVAAADGVAVLTSPLAGIAAAEIVDVRSVAADLRSELARRLLAPRLNPKISVIVDGGGPLNLDPLFADVRLRAVGKSGDAVLQVSVGGDAASAAAAGCVALADGPDAATRLLEILARRGRNVRARDVLAAEGIAPFASAIAHLRPQSAVPHAPRRTGSDAIGKHQLCDCSWAYGIGLAFGHADASLLECLMQVAGQAKAGGVIAAPGRTLMVVGMSSDGACGFAAEAERLGFIVRAEDPRRHVIACAGAPFCASAHIPAREMAPRIAADHALSLEGSFAIHVSGCAKGCAHPAPARLTIVGTSEGCALVADGTTRDAPFAVVPAEQLAAAITSAVAENRHV